MQRKKNRLIKKFDIFSNCLMGIFLFSSIISTNANAQVDELKNGAWYMYFWELRAAESSIGIQSDLQYRNWNLLGDLEQLLLRGGMYYQRPDRDWRLIGGYAYIRSGTYGESRAFSTEHRIYQEALFSQRWLERIQLIHRIRFEQRFLDQRIIRTRGRYNLFVNVAINKNRFEKDCIYLALYNELFINGERNFADRKVDYFDRNRSYAALGYHISDKKKIQVGYMWQITPDWSKGQWQLSFHHKLN